MYYTHTRNSVLLFIGVCIAVYVGYSVYTVCVGPRVTLGARSYEVSTNSAYTLVGSAKRFLSLTVNGRTVITRPDGTFADRTLLAPGTNTFAVEAVDSFGVRTQEYLTVVYTPHEGDAAHTARITPIEDALNF